MKEIITQHGWCLNANMWINLKNEFIKKTLTNDILDSFISVLKAYK